MLGESLTLKSLRKSPNTYCENPSNVSDHSMTTRQNETTALEMKTETKYLAITLIASCIFLTDCNNPNPPAHQNENQTMTKQHKDSIILFLHSYIEDIWNKRDFSKAEKYWSDDFKNVFAPQFDHGPEGMKRQVSYFLNAFQPFKFEIMDIMIDGDKISMWIEISGTHTGELFGIKPTNKQVKFRESVWYKMKGGKLDEVYPFVDWNSLFEQLGEYPKLKQSDDKLENPGSTNR